MCHFCMFILCTVKETDTHKLWKNIEPHLKKAMQTVYLREVSRCVSAHTGPPCLCACVCVCVFIIITSTVSLSCRQPAVGADAAGGGGVRSPERCQHTRTTQMFSCEMEGGKITELIWQRRTTNPHRPLHPPPPARRFVRSHSRRAAVLLQVPAHRRLPGVLQPRPHGQTLLPEGGALPSADTS